MDKIIKNERKTDYCTLYSGSITVFLTILFLLFFSLIGVAFENARVLSSAGYIRTAAHSAAMTVFGAYNRELYQDYGFFAYGGSDGKGADDLAKEFTDILIDNVRDMPHGTQRSYGSLYRFQNIEGAVSEAGVLTDRDIFTAQVEAYLKSAAVQDLTQEITNKVSGEAGSGNIKENLVLTKEYEEGKFDIPKEQGAVGEKPLSKGGALEQDTAKGNPLEVFKAMMRDGILNMVCDVRKLSDGIIVPLANSGDVSDDSFMGKQDKIGAADYLMGLMEENEVKEHPSANDREDGTTIKKGADKLKYICYASKQFSDYTEDRKRTTKYGIEYLIAGKREEKDNLASVVNKILGIRLLLNFGCILSNKTLQEKSFITATILAGFTGMPPVIRAVQYTILLILAFEEACVDVTALLEGRYVPVIKKARDIKMKYEEMCIASRRLFASKAKAYSGSGRTTAADISYQQYLWLFLLGKTEGKIRTRCYSLIQYDLREKYNQSFVIQSCICRSKYKVCYQLPFLFGHLPFLDREGLGNTNLGELEVFYEYKSG